jgi:hypothetical protein
MMWRLAKQKWANRGNQKQGFTGDSALEAFRSVMAIYLTTLSAVSLFLIVMIYTEFLVVPQWSMVRAILFS